MQKWFKNWNVHLDNLNQEPVEKKTHSESRRILNTKFQLTLQINTQSIEKHWIVIDRIIKNIFQTIWGGDRSNTWSVTHVFVTNKKFWKITRFFISEFAFKIITTSRVSF